MKTLARLYLWSFITGLALWAFTMSAVCGLGGCEGHAQTVAVYASSSPSPGPTLWLDHGSRLVSGIDAVGFKISTEYHINDSRFVFHSPYQPLIKWDGNEWVITFKP